MLAGFDRDHEFRAHAVCATDKDRIGETGSLQIKQGTEAAQSAHCAGTVRGFGCGLDGIDQGIPCCNVYTSLCIAGAL